MENEISRALVWSPQSNIILYNTTTIVSLAGLCAQ